MYGFQIKRLRKDSGTDRNPSFIKKTFTLKPWQERAVQNASGCKVHTPQK